MLTAALGWKPRTLWTDLAQVMAQADWQLVDDKLSGLRVRVDH